VVWEAGRGNGLGAVFWRRNRCAIEVSSERGQLNAQGVAINSALYWGGEGESDEIRVAMGGVELIGKAPGAGALSSCTKEKTIADSWASVKV